MGFSSLWPLALLVLVPVIILLYILKQEAKQHSFSSVMLWQEVYRNIEATKPWEKLKKNLLMLLQILTVLLFVFALMGPWLRSAGREHEQVILVLDSSASMDTLYDEEQTRLEAAKEAACSYVDSLPAGTVIHVIDSSQQAVLVLSSSKDVTEAKNRIRGIEQTSLAGDLSVSLGLVQSCASQSEDARIVFFTDTAFDMGNLEAAVENFYSEADNISVDTVGYAVKEGKLLVLAQLTNRSGKTRTAEVNLYGTDAQQKETLLDIASVEIPEGESQPVYFELEENNGTSGMQSLRAELNEKDALAGDNSAWCVVDEAGTSRVLLVTESNLFVEKAFTNLSGIELYRTSDKNLTSGQTAEAYDLYIFDGMVPDGLPDTGSFLFINCEAEDIFKNCGKVQGKMLSFVDSDVTSYVAGTKFGVNESNIYQVPSWGNSFLKSGDDCAGFYGSYDGHRIAVLGFDLHQTDLGLQAEFPVLMSELADYLLDGGLTEKNSYTAGDSVMLHGSTKGSELTLTEPDGETKTLDASQAAGSYVQVTQSGIYEVSQELDGNVKNQKFSVGFPTELESEVVSAQSMVKEDGEDADPAVRIGALDIRNYVLILLLLLLAAEWIIYIRMQ
ncbi:MAG: BatA domain-containing protein [Lachnospiraceae bacterium]|nr:BatA domain-containing protein [Lachnospiraceae bacterium]